MKEKVVQIILENRPDLEFNDDTRFVDDGLIDSFDVITFVSAFDKTFDISINGEDITPDNFNTLDSIVKMLKRNGAM